MTTYRHTALGALAFLAAVTGCGGSSAPSGMVYRTSVASTSSGGSSGSGGYAMAEATEVTLASVTTPAPAA